MKPSLAQAITQKQLVDLVNNDNWWMSQKMDGKRVLLEIEDGKITAWSRNGTPTTLPRPSRAVFKDTMQKGHFMVDGELMSGAGEDLQQKFFAFDMPVAGDLIGLLTPFEERLSALQELARLCNWTEGVTVGVLSYAKTPDEKRRLIQRLFENNAEGVIARHVRGVYKSGRRTDTLLKAKFVKSADCVVMNKGADGKDNITLGVYRNGELVEVGRCTALVGDGPACMPGEVIEVAYLYLGPHGRLVQPTNPKLRIDKDPAECDWDQLVPTDKTVLV